MTAPAAGSAQRVPVLMIGLDAADSSLVRRLADAGELPALQSLFARGCAGVLRGNASLFAGGVWPTFYTARDVPWHGLYHNKLWRHEAMRCEIAHESWVSAPPFWTSLDPGLRVAALDVPMTVASPKPLNGAHLAGWGTHDVIARGSWPAGLWQELTSKFGAPRMPAELFGPQTARTRRRLRAQLVEATDQLAAIGAALLSRERWDLFLLVFGATHRGGHYLWGDEEALVEIYRACDRGLRRLLDAAPRDARVMVYAVHGMGPNTTWADRCAEMLSRMLSGDSAHQPKQGILYTLKRMLPWRLVRAITTRLPQDVQGRLVTLWSKRMFDWGRTRAFPLPMDHAGYVRVNLRGREPAGIVAPGPEYDALCADLSAGFLSWSDLKTGRPIVRRVHRLDELAPPDAAARDRLPDLVIEWDDVSPSDVPVIASSRHGELRWPPAQLPSGRTGNHRSDGWFVAAGPGIPAGAQADGHHIMDLAPTACAWLGTDTGTRFHGRPIAALCL